MGEVEAGGRWPLWGVGRGKHPEVEEEAPSSGPSGAETNKVGRRTRKVSTRRREGEEGISADRRGARQWRVGGGEDVDWGNCGRRECGCQCRGLKWQVEVEAPAMRCKAGAGRRRRGKWGDDKEGSGRAGDKGFIVALERGKWSRR